MYISKRVFVNASLPLYSSLVWQQASQLHNSSRASKISQANESTFRAAPCSSGMMWATCKWLTYRCIYIKIFFYICMPVFAKVFPMVLRSGRAGQRTTCTGTNQKILEKSINSYLSNQVWRMRLLKSSGADPFFMQLCSVQQQQPHWYQKLRQPQLLQLHALWATLCRCSWGLRYCGL